MDADRTLELIDGALADSATGADAMRWTPRPDHPPTSDAVAPDNGGIRFQLGLNWYSMGTFHGSLLERPPAVRDPT